MEYKKTSEVVLESFWDYWKACRSEEYLHYTLKGGRNSAKSTTISQRLAMDLIEYPLNALVVRKVERTLESSVYEQLKEGIRLLGCEDEFVYNKNPLKITFKGRGNFALFRGADDPLKLKSIKTSNFPIARLWIEELTEFKTEDELQIIMDSILRGELPGGLSYKFYYSYNPPKRKQHWVNKKYESRISIPANTYVHHSTYLGNPYLSTQTLEEIEHTKAKSEKKYKWIYLGEATGGGIVPFDNLTFRTIQDVELKAFDNIRQGIDWGYATDPVCFGRMHYDKMRRTLYFIDEIYGVKISNRELADEIIKKGYQHNEIIADSAEPKSISEMKDRGLKVVGAKKGAGSVEYGEKWLDDLTEIVIDPRRTPNIAREFENIEYKVDKDGEQKTGLGAKLEDKDNHCFVAGTMIETIDGKVPIENIKLDDLVLTRDGYKKVIQLFKKEAETVISPIGLECTDTHNIITTRGEKFIKDLSIEDELYILSEGICNITVKDILTMGTDITTEASTLKNRQLLVSKQFPCIKKSGLVNMVRYRRDSISTTKTWISRIMRLKILNAFPAMNIHPNTQRFSTYSIKSKLKSIWMKLGIWLLSGTNQMMAGIGIKNTPNRLALDTGNMASVDVRYVQKNLPQNQLGKSSAPINVNQNLEETNTLMMSKRNVLNVDQLSKATDTLKQKHAQGLALINTGIKTVYNFTVEGKHEYFANRILVSNSIDMARYALERDMKRGNIRFFSTVPGQLYSN